MLECRRCRACQLRGPNVEHEGASVCFDDCSRCLHRMDQHRLRWLLLRRKKRAPVQIVDVTQPRREDPPTPDFPRPRRSRRSPDEVGSMDSDVGRARMLWWLSHARSLLDSDSNRLKYALEYLQAPTPGDPHQDAVQSALDAVDAYPGTPWVPVLAEAKAKVREVGQSLHLIEEARASIAVADAALEEAALKVAPTVDWAKVPVDAKWVPERFIIEAKLPFHFSMNTAAQVAAWLDAGFYILVGADFERGETIYAGVTPDRSRNFYGGNPYSTWDKTYRPAFIAKGVAASFRVLHIARTLAEVGTVEE